MSNIDNQNRFNLEHKKEHILRNVSCVIQDIVKCFDQRYGDLMEEAKEDATNKVKETSEGDRLLSHIFKILSSNIWPIEVRNMEEVTMKKRLSSAEAIYSQYC